MFSVRVGETRLNAGPSKQVILDELLYGECEHVLHP